MRKLALLTALAATLAAAAPAQAQWPDAYPTPYLSAAEAARAVGAALHSEYGNLRRGSLRARCAYVRKNVRFCRFVYRDRAGYWYCGRGYVRETRTQYLTRWRDRRC